MFVYILLNNFLPVNSCVQTCRSVGHCVTSVQTPENLIKNQMATPNTNQNSITDEYIRELLECPVCLETIKSAPVYQCNNGHVICKECIKELNNCPICRNDSAPARSLQLEKIVHRLEGIQPENEGPATGTPNLQKWGKGSVRSYGTINGPNQAAPIGINLQANQGHATTATGQVTTGPTTTRQVLTRTRQILSRQVNNQDVEAGLRIDRAENRPQSMVKNCVIFLCLIISLISFFGIVISSILIGCGIEKGPTIVFLFSFCFLIISSVLLKCLEECQVAFQHTNFT